MRQRFAFSAIVRQQKAARCRSCCICTEAASLANERLSQQANFAEYYFQLRGQDTLIDLYEKTVVAHRENLRLTQTRSRTGVDTEQSVAEADLNLRTAIASATNLRIARAQYEHAIALITGQAASSFSMPIRPLTTAIPAIPLGVPSHILQRRPDIAAAERTMAQANALIGVQTAAYYPTFTLGGDIGFESSKISSLFTWLAASFLSVHPPLKHCSMEVSAVGSSINMRLSTKPMPPPTARPC